MNSANIIRKILVKNTSTIPVTVIWRLYSLFSSNSCIFIGPENQLELKAPENKTLKPCLLINPPESYIEENATALLEINFQPGLFPQDINTSEFKFFIVGDVQIDNVYRSQVNYFYRKQGDDLEQIQLNIEGIVETPSLTLSKAESRSCIELYATEIISGRANSFQLLQVLSNNKFSATTFSLATESPFVIDTESKVYTLEPKQKQKVKISCMFYPEDVNDLYERAFRKTTNRADFAVHENSVKISKKLFVNHLDCSMRPVDCDRFDLTLIVNYPVLFVQPQVVKFCRVRTGCTKTGIISIYNESACEVPIRVKLNGETTNFSIFPAYGVIKATTGVNKQFLDIFIYFSPEEEKAYVETLTVCTNVKQDEISVQLTGLGSLDEKYYCNKR